MNSNDMYVCEFCGCHTIAFVCACCGRGRDSDIDTMRRKIEPEQREGGKDDTTNRSAD